MKKVILTILILLSVNTLAADFETTIRKPTNDESKRLELLLKTSELSESELDKLKKYSVLTINMLHDLGHKNFNFEEESVNLLSGIIDKEGSAYSDKTKNALSTLWGAYLGAAIIDNYGGKWVKMGDGSYAVLVGVSKYVFPMVRVYKHINNGAEDSILALYKSVTISTQKKGVIRH